MLWYNYVDPLDIHYDPDKALVYLLPLSVVIQQLYGLSDITLEIPDFYHIRTLEQACAQIAASKTNIATVNLTLATNILHKINIAAKHALKFFPTSHIYDRTQKPADLVTIFKFMSEQIMSLGIYLSVARSAGIPVNINLDFFHRSIDRFLLMGSVISKDFLETLSSPRVHYEQFTNTPNSKFFGLITTTQASWKEEIDINVHLRQYIQMGTETGNSFVHLDEKMTGYLLSKAVQTKDDPVGNWLAKELDRILLKKGPAIDSENELSVFATAFRGYRWMIQKRRDEAEVQKFLLMLRRVLFNCNKLAMETVERFMYKVIGDFFLADVIKPDPEKGRKDAHRKLESIHFKAVVDAEASFVEPVREEVDTTFAKIVQYTRSQLPFARPDQIFSLAKEMYYSEDRMAYAERATDIMLVPYVNSTGAKQNPVRRSKSSGRKETDLLRKVKKTTSTKRPDKKARLTPIVGR